MIDCKKSVDHSKHTNEVESEIDEDFKSNLESGSLIKNKRKTIDNDPSTKKKRKFEKDLYKQPTVEELNQLKETENLFHSNLFRLQIEEVVNEIKIKNKYKKLFDSWLEKFKNYLKSFEDNKELTLEDDTLFENFNIKIPMKKLPNDCVGNFKYVPPSTVTIGGSYLLDTVIGPDAIVDVFVEMPESIFRKMDSKNYRYMRKKAMYLAYIANNINDDLAENKCFVGNNSNPILKIIPSGNLGKRFTIHIHVVVQETVFLIKKFLPEKNNVKYNWFFKNKDETCGVNSPTPYYNNIILHDLIALKVNAENANIIKKYPNIIDAIILLKVWLRQRGFNNNIESFNGHIITMYVLYLVSIKKLNTFMSSYQIVRNTWLNLANSNWCIEGISICQNKEIVERIGLYQKYYDCVFLDSTGFQNLTAHIHKNIFQYISNQAQLSIDCLNNTRANSFQMLFMRKVPFYRTFDYIICLYNVKALENVVESHFDDSDKLNYGSNKQVKAIQLISNTLKQGLGNRVSLLSIFPYEMQHWNLNEEIPNDIGRLYIGLQLDPNFSFNIIEKGPSANLPEAEEFRKFWGSKSDLRRFKDGTICEAIVWAKEGATFAQKREIPQKIAKYLLEEKIKLFEKVHYFFFSNQIEDFLKLKGAKMRKFRYGTEEATLQVINIFDALAKELSNLTDLPLSINGVQGCSALFRYTDVFPPLACTRRPDKKNVIVGKTHLLFTEESLVNEAPLYLSPIDATIQLSMSGKWPDDLEALRIMKAAFHIQIADCMRKQYKSYAHGSLHHIDIMKDGLVFRLRIAHQKEIGLVKQIKDKDGVIKYRENEESIELEKKLFHLPRITGALYGLHCQQPSFGPACCLVKRWLSAQLIDDSHMPDIVVELLMASIYLNSDPYKPAQVPQVAFLRFLETFAVEHWSTDPIIVNFNNEMTREEILEVENMFGTSRDTLPCLFISTPYDKETSMWTKKAPIPLILNRITSLAMECLKLIELQLFSTTNLTCDPLFNPPLSAYDCLIKLKDLLNPRRIESTAIGKNLDKIELHPYKEHTLTKIPIVDFDPVAEYLKELRSGYDDYALFFHDTYGGNVIGVLLKPDVEREKDFKVSNAHCQKLNNNKKLILNMSAMIEDFYIIGKGLVETINIQSDRINAI